MLVLAKYIPNNMHSEKGNMPLQLYNELLAFVIIHLLNCDSKALSGNR